MTQKHWKTLFELFETQGGIRDQTCLRVMQWTIATVTMMFIRHVIFTSNKTISKTQLRPCHLPEQPSVRKEKKCRSGPLTPEY